MGKILQIQRFSIHDGPGIRTTVFLKGCPLRCAWCHNPESWSPRTEVVYQRARCVGCGRCVGVCPRGVLSLCDGKVRIDRAACDGCGRCADACPNDAWRVWGEERSADDVIGIVRKDRKYYEKSGGGVTFSGGEPLLQAAFIAEMAEKLCAEGIHTAVESALPVPWETIMPLLPYVRLWMVDVKHMDDARHRALTGVSVEPILANIRALSAAGAEVVIRVPVVPGESGSDANMNRLGAFLRDETNIRRVELLPLHKLAEHKYDSLDRPFGAAAFAVPTGEEMRTWQLLLSGYGLTVTVAGTDQKSGNERTEEDGTHG